MNILACQDGYSGPYCDQQRGDLINSTPGLETLPLYYGSNIKFTKPATTNYSWQLAVADPKFATPGVIRSGNYEALNSQIIDWIGSFVNYISIIESMRCSGLLIMTRSDANESERIMNNLDQKGLNLQNVSILIILTILIDIAITVTGLYITVGFTVFIITIVIMRNGSITLILKSNIINIIIRFSCLTWPRSR